MHKDEEKRPNYIHKLLDADMAFCANLREADVFFYVTNRASFGHLVDSDGFSTEHLNNELWEISRNRWDWEQRYIHVNPPLTVSNRGWETSNQDGQSLDPPYLIYSPPVPDQV